jgi:hypothetical protein
VNTAQLKGLASSWGLKEQRERAAPYRTSPSRRQSFDWSRLNAMARLAAATGHEAVIGQPRALLLICINCGACSGFACIKLLLLVLFAFGAPNSELTRFICLHVKKYFWRMTKA